MGDAAAFRNVEPERVVPLDTASSEGAEVSKLPNDGIGNHELCASGPSIVFGILLRVDALNCE